MTGAPLWKSFETLVVGSGPAGIAAAVRAAEHGRLVGLVDDNPALGGQIWRAHAGPSHGKQEAKWRERLHAAPITMLQGWSVFDQPAANTLRAERCGDVADFHYTNLVLATGARERFLPFPGWTLRNVVGVGAMQAMVKSGLPVDGKRIVIAGSGPLLLAVAASLQAAGAIVVCICEQASLRKLLLFALSLSAMPGKIAEGLRYKSAVSKTPFHTSAWPLEASGKDVLEAMTLSIHGHPQRFECDYLACGFHLVPNLELPALLGCKIRDGVVEVDEWQQSSNRNVFCAGETTGVGGVELSLFEGEIAGLAAAGQRDQARSLFSQRKRLSYFAARLDRAFSLRPELKGLPRDSTLVCRCEDVGYGAVRQHPSWRAAKLHTRCGMGPCQGRICGTATEFFLGWNADSTRPPIFPALISSMAAPPTLLETGVEKA
jgi:NADPH-dependent 2,4-dienoyl-CoA reductase/sulfur reductase-like enzyme